jgi:hypothetical protein
VPRYPTEPKQDRIERSGPGAWLAVGAILLALRSSCGLPDLPAEDVALTDAPAADQGPADTGDPLPDAGADGTDAATDPVSPPAPQVLCDTDLCDPGQVCCVSGETGTRCDVACESGEASLYCDGQADCPSDLVCCLGLVVADADHTGIVSADCRAQCSYQAGATGTNEIQACSGVSECNAGHGCVTLQSIYATVFPGVSIRVCEP